MPTEDAYSFGHPSSLVKVPIRFSPLPLGGFRQVLKHSANLRLTSFASNMLVVGSMVMYQFVCICQRGTGWAYDDVLTTYKPYSTLIFDANDVSRKLAECLKTCLNPPRGRGEKRIETLASEDAGHLVLSHFWTCMCSNVETNLS